MPYIVLRRFYCSSINRGINKKEDIILGYFNVYNILIFIT